MIAEGSPNRPAQARISYVAIAALVCGVIGLGVFAVRWPSYGSSHVRPEEMLKRAIFCAAACSALILGCIAVAQTAHCVYGTLKGRRLAYLAIVLALVSIGSAIVGSWKSSRVPAAARCGPNLSGLGKAMLIYAYDYDVLPVADQWCDLLVNHAEVAPKLLICPASDARRGQSSYAMNNSAAGKPLDGLPHDLVLLYESSPGWNQAGGPELLSTASHEGLGCNVLLVNGVVRFIKTGELAQLKWTAEEKRAGALPAERQP